MSKQIAGVEHKAFDEFSIFYISELSDDLKAVIRNCLASVCHGAAKAATGRQMYCYKITLQEFLRRYNGKSESTRKGMIGELLLHILRIFRLTPHSLIWKKGVLKRDLMLF